MARKYKRLNYEDRKAIEAMCKQGKRAEEIAEAMDVHRATIYHEPVSYTHLTLPTNREV